MRLRVARHARLQIEDIFWLIATDNPQAARAWLAKLDRCFEQIEAFPLSGRVVPEFDISTLREVLHGDYRVLHLLGNDAITVTSVVHGARLLRLGRDVHAALSEDE